jgi:hypothetical protein
MKYLLENLHWALTPEAEMALNDMESMGIDRDLALCLLEKFWPEGRVYDFGDENGPYMD